MMHLSMNVDGTLADLLGDVADEYEALSDDMDRAALVARVRDALEGD